jgi:hypothetical protein
MGNATSMRDIVAEMAPGKETRARQLEAWGGKITLGEQISKLEMFLQHWEPPRAAMPWSIWQWTDAMEIKHMGAPPEDLAYLERGHVFGKAGHLELRRDGDYILWRYVGEPDTLPTEFEPKKYHGANYWETRPTVPFLRPYRRTALLWGEYVAQSRRWYADRVGWADLAYTTLEGNERVQMTYIEYLNGSSIELVRLLGLEPYPASEQAGGA